MQLSTPTDKWLAKPSVDPTGMIEGASRFQRGKNRSSRGAFEDKFLREKFARGTGQFGMID
jgi:hypothetical protein